MVKYKQMNVLLKRKLRNGETTKKTEGRRMANSRREWFSCLHFAKLLKNEIRC